MVEGCWYILKGVCQYGRKNSKNTELNVRISVNYTNEKTSGSNLKSMCRE